MRNNVSSGPSITVDEATELRVNLKLYKTLLRHLPMIQSLRISICAPIVPSIQLNDPLQADPLAQIRAPIEKKIAFMMTVWLDPACMDDPRAGITKHWQDHDLPFELKFTWVDVELGDWSRPEHTLHILHYDLEVDLRSQQATMASKVNPEKRWTFSVAR
jgi:hypothetical protein